VGGLRKVAASFVVPGPSGVAIRARLRVSETDAAVLQEVGAFLGALAARDLAVRSRQGRDHDAAAWAGRKRELSGVSSARWAGSITKATHDQWALARRGQATHMAWLRGQIATIEARLARPLHAKADKRAGLVRGYGSRAEWHAKSRRLHALRERLAALEEDWAAGRVHVVRGGKQLAHLRHHLDQAGLDEQMWRQRWQAARMFLAADGESGKRLGNETIRITEDGQISIKLPAALAHLANAPHGRYVLDAPAVFRHRGEEWLDRITNSRAVAYRIHHDTVRGRWYVRLENLEPNVTARGRPSLTAAVTETDRLARMVEALLAMARLEEDAATPAPLDVGAICAERHRTWLPLFDERDVSLVLFAGSVGPVMALPGSIEQILDNLLSNALRASPPATTVTIELRLHAPPRRAARRPPLLGRPPRHRRGPGHDAGPARPRLRPLLARPRRPQGRYGPRARPGPTPGARERRRGEPARGGHGRAGRGGPPALGRTAHAGPPPGRQTGRAAPGGSGTAGLKAPNRGRTGLTRPDRAEVASCALMVPRHTASDHVLRRRSNSAGGEDAP
jgi:signal transduction histidine kinase